LSPPTKTQEQKDVVEAGIELERGKEKFLPNSVIMCIFLPIFLQFFVGEKIPLISVKMYFFRLIFLHFFVKEMIMMLLERF